MPSLDDRTVLMAFIAICSNDRAISQTLITRISLCLGCPVGYSIGYSVGVSQIIFYINFLMFCLGYLMGLRCLYINIRKCTS